MKHIQEKLCKSDRRRHLSRAHNLGPPSKHVSHADPGAAEIVKLPVATHADRAKPNKTKPTPRNEQSNRKTTEHDPRKRPEGIVFAFVQSIHLHLSHFSCRRSMFSGHPNVSLLSVCS
jgi:hypothetical protein